MARRSDLDLLAERTRAQEAQLERMARKEDDWIGALRGLAKQLREVIDAELGITTEQTMALDEAQAALDRAAEARIATVKSRLDTLLAARAIDKN